MPAPLTDRTKAYLDFLCRHRISTAERNTALCGGSENVAKKLIATLDGYIASDPLGQKTRYYRLTPLGAKALGAPEEIARPLGPQALPRALGVLGFCTSAEQRQRYLRREFQADFPELAGSLLNKDYHTD